MTNTGGYNQILEPWAQMPFVLQGVFRLSAIDLGVNHITQDNRGDARYRKRLLIVLS